MGSEQQRALFDAWAEHYDLVEGDREAMARFYGDLVNPRTLSVLELACGTGTITLALVRRLDQTGGGRQPRRVVGLDESAPMLRFARAKVHGVEWVEADMRTPPVRGPFDLVVCCYNAIQLLPSEKDLVAFFVVVRSLVATKGVFAFDVIQPNLPYLLNPEPNRLMRTLTDATGRRLEQRRDYFYDPGTRLLRVEQRLVDPDVCAATPLARLLVEYRQYATVEIEAALASAGFTICSRYGDFDRSPLVAASKKQIFVCTPQDRGRRADKRAPLP